MAWKNDRYKHGLASRGISMSDKEWVDWNRKRVHKIANEYERKWDEHYKKHKSDILQRLKKIYNNYVLGYGNYKSEINEIEGIIEIIYNLNNQKDIDEIRWLIGRLKPDKNVATIELNTDEGILVIIPKNHPSMVV